MAEFRSDDLPEALQLALYRIVLEVLTNVVKHAAPTRSRVTVMLEPGLVSVQVVDDGPARSPQPGPGGHGLTGMHERVAMYGAAAIRVVASGEALLAPAVTRRLIAEFARRPEPARPLPRSLDGVTGREREVLTLIGRGLSNSDTTKE